MGLRYDYKIVYTVVERLVIGNVISNFGDREILTDGYIALPCYLLEEITKYLDYKTTEKEYLVVLARNIFDLNKEEVPDRDIYGKFSNSRRVEEVYNDYQTALDRCNELNNVSSISKNYPKEKIEKITDELTLFTKKREIIIQKLNTLSTFTGNKQCSVCEKYFSYGYLKEYKHNPICNSCFIKRETKLLTLDLPSENK